MPKILLETGQWTRETLHLDPGWQHVLTTGKFEFSWETWLSILFFIWRQEITDFSDLWCCRDGMAAAEGNPGACTSVRQHLSLLLQNSCKKAKKSGPVLQRTFSTREGLIPGSFVQISTLVWAQSCSQSQKWLFLPSSLQWRLVPRSVGSHCVVSRTWRPT